MTSRLPSAEERKSAQPVSLDSPALRFESLTNYEFSSPDESKALPVYNPANGSLITTVRVGDAQTAKDAVTRSHAAFLAWRHRPPAQRGQILIRCADLLLNHVEELATLLCLENGKPYVDARFGDCMALQNSFRYFGSLIDKLPTEYYDRGPMTAHTVREPHGVCVGGPSRYSLLHGPAVINIDAQYFHSIGRRSIPVARLLQLLLWATACRSLFAFAGLSAID